MNYAKIDSKYFCGADLHAQSMYIKIVDKQGQVLLKRNMPNNFELFKQTLERFIPDIAVGCESTFNYYWLYDGCKQSAIPFYLGHAAYMKAIAGNKKKNDPLDAETIAHLMRSNLFPEAYPYPKQMRAVRDLLRRRQRLVHIRSEAYAHVQLLLRQQGIISFKGKDVKSVAGKEEILTSISDGDVYSLVNSDIVLIKRLDELTESIEKQIKERAYIHNAVDFGLLKTISGVGDMLALSILYETHDIRRFKNVQKYASYSRVIRVKRSSAGRTKYGGGNTKMGNPYLKNAFGQILSHARQSSAAIDAYYRKLEATRCPKLARGIMAHMFCVAAYHMLKKKTAFDEKRFLRVTS